MHVTIVGTGYVGLVSGACLAELGHHVTCVDTDAGKIAKLTEGVIPIFEPGLEELVERMVRTGHLRFTTSFAEAIPGAEVISIAVGTPSAADGTVDMQYVDSAARMIGKHLTGYAVIADKSTVPVGTCERVAGIVRAETSQPFDVVSNPEFLSEGHAVYDFLHPSRVVIGSSTARATETMLKLYGHLECQKLVMEPRSAELTKYASNAFLATKISFINEVSHLCELVGADVEQVARGMGSDPRIGKEFLKAGIGWGGSCFPKDVLAIRELGVSLGHPMPMVNATIAMNQLARTRIIERLESELTTLAERIVAVLGLAFKGNTDDTRESAAIDLVQQLVRRGAIVRVYDPVARLQTYHGLDIPHSASPYEAAAGAHAIVIATEWEEFRTLDLPRLRQQMQDPLLIDARNILNHEKAAQAGFRYLRVGRS